MKPEFDSLSFHYDSHDSDTHTGYYSFTLGIKNIPSDWDYRKTIFSNLQKITVKDVLEWASKNEFELSTEVLSQ